MNLEEYSHFVCIVAGDDPVALLDKYRNDFNPVKRVVYKYDDAPELKAQFARMYKALIDASDPESKDHQYYTTNLNYLNTITSDDFFEELCQNYSIDEETGDAYVVDNPNGKFEGYNIGQKFSMPFVLMNGSECYQAKKKDINWSAIHLANQDTYRITWETVMEGREPKDENERTIFHNMEHRTAYLRKFENKDIYVASCTAFWGLAFLSEETGWVELTDEDDQFEWMINYLNRFIFPLDGETKLSIFECRR